MPGCRGNGGALSHCQLWIIARCRRSNRSSGKGHEGSAFAKTIAQRNAATMTLETIAPLSDDAIVNLPALAA